ncbi:MAG: HNH endonuclease [Planctomycetota bacterium]
MAEQEKKYRLGDGVDTSECVIWEGAKNGSGYPIKWHNGRARLYNRVLWREHKGPIPKGRCICHKCDNPSCVNLDHLFLGSYRQNTLDMIRKGRARHPVGEAHGLAKLTENDVREIRKLFDEGMRITDLQIKFKDKGGREAVRCAARRKTWKHVV